MLTQAAYDELVDQITAELAQRQAEYEEAAFRTLGSAGENPELTRLRRAITTLEGQRTDTLAAMRAADRRRALEAKDARLRNRREAYDVAAAAIARAVSAAVELETVISRAHQLFAAIDTAEGHWRLALMRGCGSTMHQTVASHELTDVRRVLELEARNAVLLGTRAQARGEEIRERVAELLDLTTSSTISVIEPQPID